MCGIVGLFGHDPPLLVRNQIQNAIKLIQHRGPDQAILWEEDRRFSFGQTRLSIIDVPGGAQPIQSESGRLVMIWNGEIYNYKLLRRILESRGVRFRTNSDGEVLINLLEVLGPQGLAACRGMFAAAVANLEAGTMCLLRDPLGEKPLFYSLVDGVCSFASEIPAMESLLAHTVRRLDREALRYFLALNYQPPGMLLNADIREVLPGTITHISAELTSTSHTYWRPEDFLQQDDAYHGDMDACLGDLQQLLDKAVSRNFTADVPVTVLASGGIDSSLILESATRQGLVDEAYSLTFAESAFNVSSPLSKFCRDRGVRLKHVYSDRRLVSDIHKLSSVVGLPLADSSSLVLGHLLEAVSCDYRVAISGDGGDEVFGGYLTRVADALRSYLPQLPPSFGRVANQLSSMIPGVTGPVPSRLRFQRLAYGLQAPSDAAHFIWNGAWMPQQIAELLDEDAMTVTGALCRLSETGEGPARDSLNRFMIADLKVYLPGDILRKSDLCGMGFSVEVRSPFLDRDVVEFGLRNCYLSYGRKLGQIRSTKPLLRKLASRSLGRAFASQPKRGFGVPLRSWMLQMDPLWLESQTASRLTQYPHIGIDPGRISSFLERMRAGDLSVAYGIWGILVLGLHEELVATIRSEVCCDDLSIQRVVLRRGQQ